MNEKILFSIVIPVYNAQNTIKRTLLSVLNQTYSNYEIIIVNDGSTDNSTVIINDFKDNNKIKIITQDNAGVSAARNNGIRNCIGEYVIFLDADDWVDNNFLLIFKDHLDSFKDNSIDLIIGNLKDERIRTLTQYGYFSNKDIPSVLGELEVTDNIGYLHNKCYRKELIDESTLRFLEGITMSEDLLFNLRFLYSLNNLLIISNSSYHYEDIADSLSKKKVNYHELKIRKKYVTELYDIIIQKHRDSDLRIFIKGISKRILALDMQIVTSMYYSSCTHEDIMKEINYLKEGNYSKGIFSLLNRNEKMKYLIMNLNSIAAYYFLCILYKMRAF